MRVPLTMICGIPSYCALKRKLVTVGTDGLFKQPNMKRIPIIGLLSAGLLLAGCKKDEKADVSFDSNPYSYNFTLGSDNYSASGDYTELGLYCNTWTEILNGTEYRVIEIDAEDASFRLDAYIPITAVGSYTCTPTSNIMEGAYLNVSVRAPNSLFYDGFTTRESGGAATIQITEIISGLLLGEVKGNIQGTLVNQDNSSDIRTFSGNFSAVPLF